MNNQRRKVLEEANGLLQKAIDIVKKVQEEEQGAYDNMPNSLQESDRGEQMQEYVSQLEEMADSLDEQNDTLMEIIKI